MGKVYTFIHKGQVNAKVKTELLDEYLAASWELGNWNQAELNARSGAGVSAKLTQLKAEGLYEEWEKNRSSKVTAGLKKFWATASDEYKSNREVKKELSRQNWTKEEKLEYHLKMSESAKKNRVTITEEEYRRRNLVSTETKKKNGTLNTSSQEQECLKLLLDTFGKDDVYYQFCEDDRYPFICDFYIKSLDLFIELNLYFTHGYHPFNKNNQYDVLKLEDLLAAGDARSLAIADIWVEEMLKNLIML